MRKFFKIINLILIGFLIIAITDNINEIHKLDIKNFIWLIVFIISPIISIITFKTLKKEYEFNEWDKKERIKRNSFYTTLTFCIFTFTYLSVFFLSISLFDLVLLDIGTLSKVNKVSLFGKIIYGILFLLNSFYTTKIHDFLYSDYLELDELYITKKPQNWDEETEIEDIILKPLKNRNDKT